MSQGQYVFNVIQNQAMAWPALSSIVQPFQHAGPYIFIGSGTSFYLAQVACAKALKNGIPAVALPTAEIILDPEIWLDHPVTLIIISRSGTTSEAILAAQKAKEYHIPIIAVTCHHSTPLANLADQVLVADDGDEDTVVMIRSFTTMLVLLQSSIDLVAHRSQCSPVLLADAAQPVLEQANLFIPLLLRTAPRRVYVLGGGLRQGIAEEGVLKLQEMAGAVALAFNPLEFRHGPWGSLENTDAVFLLGQRDRVQYEHPLYKDLLQRTSHITVVAREDWFGGLDIDASSRLELPNDIPDEDAGPLAVLPLQILAWHMARLTGENPDAPKNLTPVVVLNHE